MALNPMIEGPRPRGIAFDCYGTLLTIRDERGPYRRLAALAGGRLDPSPMTSIMTLRDVVARNVIPIQIGDDALQELEVHLQAELASIEPLPGVLDVLSRLRERGYRFAVVSNLAVPYAKPIEDWLGSLIDVTVLSFEIGAPKPSAAIYEEACRRLALRPSEVLMIGDSLRNDVASPMAAGLQARHLRPGATLRQAVHDLL